jgi:hypothetical protein
MYCPIPPSSPFSQLSHGDYFYTKHSDHVLAQGCFKNTVCLEVSGEREGRGAEGGGEEEREGRRKGGEISKYCMYI